MLFRSEQFKIQFPEAMANKRFVIRPSHVSDLILGSNAGGDMFKRNFVILFYSLIVDSQKSGVLSLKILQYLSDVSRIRDYDWCDLIFRDALEFRIDWARSNESIFRGPVFLFLVCVYLYVLHYFCSVFILNIFVNLHYFSFYLQLCYLDRVMIRNIKVSRSLPLIKSWSTRMIKDRENNEMVLGGFGRGKLLDPVAAQSDHVLSCHFIPNDSPPTSGDPSLPVVMLFYF